METVAFMKDLAVISWTVSSGNTYCLSWRVRETGVIFSRTD